MRRQRGRLVPGEVAHVDIADHAAAAGQHGALRADDAPVAQRMIGRLGVAGGYLVAFGGLWGPPWGIAGMWLMQSVALALAALLLVGFYLGLPQLRRYRRPRLT